MQRNLNYKYVQCLIVSLEEAQFYERLKNTVQKIQCQQKLVLRII